MYSESFILLSRILLYSSMLLPLTVDHVEKAGFSLLSASFQDSDHVRLYMLPHQLIDIIYPRHYHSERSDIQSRREVISIIQGYI